MLSDLTSCITVTPQKARELEERFHIKKKSVDARQRNVVVNLTIYTDEDGHFLPKQSQLPYPQLHFEDIQKRQPFRSVIIVGCGPAGLFAALTFLQHGIQPIIFERGKEVLERKKDVAKLHRNLTFNPESNYCFGEGGAGTFSDGKLYTRSNKRGNIEQVLQLFHHFGATDNILYEHHPHIGSDKLPTIIKNMRNCILERGGEIHFQTKIDHFTQSCNPFNHRQTPVILAIGHSAHDSMRRLYEEGFDIRPKGLAIGVRVEHPQHLIDDLMWHHQPEMISLLGHASYSLSTIVEKRGVYSFCMCPGGMIVPASSQSDLCVVNGMSSSLRNSPFANSGVVVEIRPEDVEANYPLAMLDFQETLERTAWKQGYREGSLGLQAPAQRLVDFTQRKVSTSLPTNSYLPGLCPSPLHAWLPSSISHRLARAFLHFNRQYPGWLTNEAVAVGVESRTSSPIFIYRHPQNRNISHFPHIYPCGEGAGYAGGITSSAIDGINTALAIIKNNGW